MLPAEVAVLQNGTQKITWVTQQGMSVFYFKTDWYMVSPERPTDSKKYFPVCVF